MLIKAPGNQALSKADFGNNMMPTLIKINPSATIRLTICP